MIYVSSIYYLYGWFESGTKNLNTVFRDSRLAP